MSKINNLKGISTKHSAEFLEAKYREEENYGTWKWFTISFKNIFNFRGRSRRKEYFSYGLISVSFGNALLALPIDNSEFLMTIAGGVIMLLFIPIFALNARRLHDIGLPGYLQLTIIIPIIFCLFKETSPKDNKWGAPAKRVKPD
ncbi:DUF805 domain-containing protein [Psychrobacter alimentarius]|uniref:DUF805 domain-containing protein n=1 Tax=Psychrobacter alimentarius TaxID=261164 RepID=UPI003FCF36DD